MRFGSILGRSLLDGWLSFYLIKGLQTLLITIIASAMNDPQRLLAHGGRAHRRSVAPLVEHVRDGWRRGAEGPTSSKLGPTGVVR
jgi:hypothetical protein